MREAIVGLIRRPARAVPQSHCLGDNPMAWSWQYARLRPSARPAYLLVRDCFARNPLANLPQRGHATVRQGTLCEETAGLQATDPLGDLRWRDDLCWR
jgi:hypothetical protein